MKKSKKFLKNMMLSSVDLCGRGCNPEAEIKLMKSMEGGETIVTELEIIAKAFEESCSSIRADSTLTNAAKEEMFCKSLFEMNDYIAKRIHQEAPARPTDDDDDGYEDEDEALDDGESKDGGRPGKAAQCKKGDDESMPSIDVNKMTPEDKETLKALARKYAEEQEAERNMHPEVKKALGELEMIKKSLALKELSDIAKKYEVIGKQANETAEKLYALKKAGGTAYDDYVSLMDEMVGQQENLGIFKEIGSNRAGSIHKDLESAIAEIQKAQPTLSRFDAIELAYRNNPELSET